MCDNLLITRLPIPSETASFMVGQMKIIVILDGLINKNVELKRANKIRKEYDKISSKLENPKFIENAPIELIETLKLKLAELKMKLQILE